MKPLSNILLLRVSGNLLFTMQMGCMQIFYEANGSFYGNPLETLPIIQKELSEVYCILVEMFDPHNLIFSDQTEIAIVENGYEWTYAELLSYVTKYANYFYVHKISKLFLDLPQGFHGYAIIWASYFSGTTICPVSPEIPLARKEIVLNKFLPDLIISLDSKLNKLPKAKTLESLFVASSIELRDLLGFTPNSPYAYVIFTSGSAGTPKGVVVSRKSLHNFLNWSCSQYKLTKGERWGQYSNLGFDLSICDIFTCLSQGATLITLSSKLQKLFPGKFIKTQKISFWHSVPGVIELMFQSNQLTQSFLNTVRIMSFCGEKLFPYQLERLFAANPNLIIYNNYGPTEGTIYCTSQKITRENYLHFCTDTVSIGTAIPGYHIQLKPDEKSDLEIVIISDYISEGYLFEDSSEQFQKCDLNGKPTRCYKTGDFVKQINGNVYFVNRKDAQVKINGHRIDLNEIDYWIRSWQPSIPCVTIFRDCRVISFIQTNEKVELELLHYLASKLPFYYLPYKIVCVSCFPYTQNQKINIQSLYTIYLKRIMQTNE